MIQQEQPGTREEQASELNEAIQQQGGQEPEACPFEPAFRPLTRVEQRNLWMKEFGEQDVALQMWIHLVEKQNIEITMMLQMHGLLIFGTMVSTLAYTQFYTDLNEEAHRAYEPATADTLRECYAALLPPQNQPEIGQEGLPIILHYVHLRDVTMMSAGHVIRVPFWRGKIRAVDAFVMGATPAV